MSRITALLYGRGIKKYRCGCRTLTWDMNVDVDVDLEGGHGRGHGTSVDFQYPISFEVCFKDSLNYFSSFRSIFHSARAAICKFAPSASKVIIHDNGQVRKWQT